VLKESSKDWWEVVPKRSQDIMDRLTQSVLTKEEAIEELNDLLIEVIMTEKMEQPKPDEVFQYAGIKTWVQNIINSLNSGDDDAST
jgi:hypothetical protein